MLPKISKIYYFILFFLIISCGKITPKGNLETKQIDLSEFLKAELDGNFRVFYVKSEKNFVTIETYKNIGDNLNIKVKDKTLYIKENRPTEAVDFYNITIYSKYDLNEISMSKLAEMNLSSEIKTDNFKLNLKNNAKFIGSVNSRRAEVEMTQKSRANFLGKTKDAVIKIADTASLIAPYWFIDNLKIDSKNENYAEVNVKDSLKGDIKNTAKFVYYNDPIRAFKIEKTANVNNKELK